MKIARLFWPKSGATRPPNHRENRFPPVVLTGRRAIAITAKYHQKTFLFKTDNRNKLSPSEISGLLLFAFLNCNGLCSVCARLCSHTEVHYSQYSAIAILPRILPENFQNGRYALREYYFPCHSTSPADSWRTRELFRENTLTVRKE